MSHDHVEEMLARRSELTPAEERQLEAHLGDCPQCRATAAAYEQQTRLLRSLPPVNPPASLRAGVLAGIQQVQPRRRWWSPRPLALLGPAVATLLVVAALAFHNLHTEGQSGNTAAPPVPATASPHGPAYGAAAGTGSKGSHRTASQPKHLSRNHPPAQRTRGRAPAQIIVPTGPAIQNVPGAAPGPVRTPAAADTAFGPVVSSAARKAHSPVQMAPQAPGSPAASHPVPTSPPGPRPPVVVAPVRPTASIPTPILLTPVPVTHITAVAAPASSPVSTATPTPTPGAHP